MYILVAPTYALSYGGQLCLFIAVDTAHESLYLHFVVTITPLLEVLSKVTVRSLEGHCRVTVGSL